MENPPSDPVPDRFTNTVSVAKDLGVCVLQVAL